MFVYISMPTRIIFSRFICKYVYSRCPHDIPSCHIICISDIYLFIPLPSWWDFHRARAFCCSPAWPRVHRDSMFFFSSRWKWTRFHWCTRGVRWRFWYARSAKLATGTFEASTWIFYLDWIMHRQRHPQLHRKRWGKNVLDKKAKRMRFCPVLQYRRHRRGMWII